MGGGGGHDTQKQGSIVHKVQKYTLLQTIFKIITFTHQIIIINYDFSVKILQALKGKESIQCDMVYILGRPLLHLRRESQTKQYNSSPGWCLISFNRLQLLIDFCQFRRKITAF